MFFLIVFFFRFITVLSIEKQLNRYTIQYQLIRWVDINKKWTHHRYFKSYKEMTAMLKLSRYWPRITSDTFSLFLSLILISGTTCRRSARNARASAPPRWPAPRRHRPAATCGTSPPSTTTPRFVAAQFADVLHVPDTLEATLIFAESLVARNN